MLLAVAFPPAGKRVPGTGRALGKVSPCGISHAVTAEKHRLLVGIVLPLRFCEGQPQIPVGRILWADAWAQYAMHKPRCDRLAIRTQRECVGFGHISAQVARPDPAHAESAFQHFVNAPQRTAESIVYSALEKLGQQVSKDPVAALEQAVKNVTPLLQVKPRRVGGATYQVPVEVEPERGLFLALSWLIQSARSRKGKAMHEKLADELAEAFQGQGTTIKKREDTHKMAEANRAFAHYRW